MANMTYKKNNSLKFLNQVIDKSITTTHSGNAKKMLHFYLFPCLCFSSSNIFDPVYNNLLI